MPEEIEAKVRIPGAPGAEAFRRRMEASGPGAPGTRTVFEVNRLFDDAEESLRRRGAAVRLREERSAADGRTIRTMLAYKSPLVESPLKRRPEVETQVDSSDAVATILEAIGLSETFRYEKRRTVWRVGECEVALDEVPHLGWFVEVEGPSEKAVRARLADLGLADAEIIRTDYVHLLVERLESLGRDPARAVFEEGTS